MAASMEEAGTMTVQDTRQNPAGKRKAALSPELSELLHMLKSLESELDTKTAPR